MRFNSKCFKLSWTGEEGRCSRETKHPHQSAVLLIYKMNYVMIKAFEIHVRIRLFILLTILMELWIRGIVSFFRNSLTWSRVRTALDGVIYLAVWCVEQRRLFSLSWFWVRHWLLSLLLLHVRSVIECIAKCRCHVFLEFTSRRRLWGTCFVLHNLFTAFEFQIILSHVERIPQRFSIKYDNKLVI